MNYKHVVQQTVLLTLLAALFSTGCSKQESTDSEPRSSETHDVEIVSEGFMLHFDPEELTVKQGDTVRWSVRKKGDFHLKFQDYPDGAEEVLSTNDHLESPDLTKADDTWEVTFTEKYPTGEYHYVCTKHEEDGLQGWVEVTSGK